MSTQIQIHNFRHIIVYNKTINDNSSENLPPILMKLGSFDAFLRKMKESNRKNSEATLKTASISLEPRYWALKLTIIEIRKSVTVMNLLFQKHKITTYK